MKPTTPDTVDPKRTLNNKDSNIVVSPNLRVFGKKKPESVLVPLKVKGRS